MIKQIVVPFYLFSTLNLTCMSELSMLVIKLRMMSSYKLIFTKVYDNSR